MDNNNSYRKCIGQIPSVKLVNMTLAFFHGRGHFAQHVIWLSFTTYYAANLSGILKRNIRFKRGEFTLDAHICFDNGGFYYVTEILLKDCIFLGK